MTVGLPQGPNCFLIYIYTPKITAYRCKHGVYCQQYAYYDPLTNYDIVQMSEFEIF